MKFSLVNWVVAVPFSSLILFNATCGVESDRPANPLAKQSPPSSVAQSQRGEVPKLNPTVRFLAEPSVAPELFSRGSFIDERNAWVASGFQVRRTTDGGATWQAMRPSNEDETVFGKMGGVYVTPYFISPTRGWLSASKGTWQTDDGGDTWRQIFTEHTDNPTFSDDIHGWIGVYTEKHQQSYVTKDGGQTWQSCGPKRGLNKQTPGQAFFLTPQLGWAVTSHIDDERRTSFGVAHTSDGGCAWRQLWTENGDRTYCDIYFLNETEGWLAGCFATGSLLHTKDGGKTWHKFQTPIETWRAAPVYMHFSTSTEGWVILRDSESGGPRGMYWTSDGGRTWRNLTHKEIVEGGFTVGSHVHRLPLEWKAGRLFQMLYVSQKGLFRK